MTLPAVQRVLVSSQGVLERCRPPDAKPQHRNTATTCLSDSLSPRSDVGAIAQGYLPKVVSGRSKCE